MVMSVPSRVSIGASRAVLPPVSVTSYQRGVVIGGFLLTPVIHSLICGTPPPPLSQSIQPTFPGPFEQSGIATRLFGPNGHSMPLLGKYELVRAAAALALSEQDREGQRDHPAVPGLAQR